MLDEKLLDNLYFSQNYKKFIEELSQNPHILLNRYPIEKKLAKYIFEKKDLLLKDLFKNYILVNRKIYLNEDLKKIIPKYKKQRFINFYFLINEKGYIPSINNYQSYLLTAVIKHKTKKEKIYACPYKAIFSDLKIDYTSNIFLELILNLSNSYKVRNKMIFASFDSVAKKIFLTFDILTYDIFLFFLNNENKDIFYLRDIYKFTKQTENNPTSPKQLTPYKKRLEYLGLNINDNKIFTDKFQIFEKSINYFYIPSEIYCIDGKNEILKRLAYYIFYIGQIKYLKKDKNPIRVSTLLSNSGIDFLRIKNQKGFPYIAEKLLHTFELLESYFQIKLDKDYKNFEQFLERKVFIKLKNPYKKRLFDVLKRNSSK